MSAETSERILQFLREATEPQSANEIAPALGFQSARQISPSIFKLHRGGKVEKIEGKPSLWLIKSTESGEADDKPSTNLGIEEKFPFQLASENEEERETFVIDRKGTKVLENPQQGSVTQETLQLKTEPSDASEEVSDYQVASTSRTSFKYFTGGVKQDVDQTEYQPINEQVDEHLTAEHVDVSAVRSPKSKTLHDQDENDDDSDTNLSRSCKRVCLDPDSGFFDHVDKKNLLGNAVHITPLEQPHLARETHSTGNLSSNIPQSPADILTSSSHFAQVKQDVGQVDGDGRDNMEDNRTNPLLATQSIRTEFEEPSEFAVISDTQMDTDAGADEVDQFSGTPAVCAAPKNPVQERIVRYLTSCNNRKDMTTKITKAVGFRTKKEINRELYTMQKMGLVKKVQESPPVWELCQATGQRSSFNQAPGHPKHQPRGKSQSSKAEFKTTSVDFQTPRQLMSLNPKNAARFPAGPSTDLEPQVPVSQWSPMVDNSPRPPVPMGRGRGILSMAAQSRVRAKNGPMDGPHVGSTGSGLIVGVGRGGGGGGGGTLPPSPAELLKGGGIFGAQTNIHASGQFGDSGKPAFPSATTEVKPLFGGSIASQRQRQPGSHPANWEHVPPSTSQSNSQQQNSSLASPNVPSIFDTPASTGNSINTQPDQQQNSLMSALNKHSVVKAAPSSEPRGQRTVNTPSFSINIPPNPRSILGLGAQPNPYPSQNLGMSMTSNMQNSLAPNLLSSGSLGAISTDSFAALNKNPVSALMEYAQARKATATIEIVGQRGPPHNPKFRLAAFIGKRKFPEVESSNKKEGKKEAADIALRTLMAEGEYKASQKVTTSLATLGKASTHFDRMAALAHGMFNKLAVHVAETMSGRKILAAIIMTRGSGDQGTVVSVGTGNRCITGNYMSLEGQTINDSHAEIISRRGLIRFIYQQIRDYAPGDPNSILEQGHGDRLKIKDAVSFHLYISTAPCGDGALFSPRDSHSAQGPYDDSRQEHQPLFSSKVQGVLRTKMEGGEGTIPIEANFKSQTWDGILRGERLRTMSCSDKICRWNIVGMQGALLSHFVEPIYLESLSLGLLYDHGHLSRAVCCRLSHDEPDLSGALPTEYRINHPRLGRVTVCDAPRETQKTKEYSINWTVGDSRPEVVDGTKGICANARTLDDQVSRVAKCSLYALFKSACKQWGRQDLLSLQTYGEAKARAGDFQKVKQLMYDKFRVRGYGPWVSKPQEEEMFS